MGRTVTSLRTEIVRMWKAGHTYHEIAMALHCSRNAVAGHIYRHRNGRGVAAPKDPQRDDMIRRAMIAHGGNKNAVARDLRVHHSSIRKAIQGTDIPQLPQGNVRSPNMATDPATREVIDLVDKSSLTDAEITERVGMARTNLNGWRSGRHVGTPFLLECVREALTATKR